MQMRDIGKSGIKASAIGLGIWAIGGGPWWGKTEDKESVQAIQAALDSGINFIDTAPAYGFGRSEEVIGKAIRGRRDKTVLATKCGLWWHDNQGVEHFKLEGKTVRRILKPVTIRQELEMSLQRLQTDHIDLYQTHWQSPRPEQEPIHETMQCLLQLKQAGKIRAIGASNVTLDQIKAYQAAGSLDSIQPRYSMLDRAIEKDILPYCRRSNISILAYSPLEQGLLTGKIGMDRKFSATEYRNTLPWFKPENRCRVLAMLSSWQDLTAKYKCSVGPLVIAWTLAQPGLTFTLCGARHANQVEENAAAGSLMLSSENIKRMRKDIEALGPPL